MDRFSDFLWYLLTTPLKRVEKTRNAWWALFKVIGNLLDQNKEVFFRAREETMVATCSVDMLPQHAEDRKLSRYKGEEWEDFRRRIATYPEVCRLGGTNPGIMLAVLGLGYKGFYIRTAVELNGDFDRWAEFYLIFPMNMDEGFPIGTNILKRVVRDTKETGARDNYQFQYLSSASHDIRSASIITIISRCYPHPNQPVLLLDGGWELDGTYELSDYMTTSQEHYPLFLGDGWMLNGSYRLGGYQLEDDLDLYPVTVTTVTSAAVKVHTESALTVKKDLWYLDGEDLLDGSRSLAADIFECEI